MTTKESCPFSVIQLCLCFLCYYFFAGLWILLAASVTVGPMGLRLVPCPPASCCSSLKVTSPSLSQPGPEVLPLLPVPFLYSNLFTLQIRDTNLSAHVPLPDCDPQLSCFWSELWRWAWSISLSLPVCPHLSEQLGRCWEYSTLCPGKHSFTVNIQTQNRYVSQCGLVSTLHVSVLVCRIAVTAWDTFTCPSGKVGE